MKVERTEIVEAFVVLKRGFAASDELAEELRLHVCRCLSAHAYPRDIAFVEELPKTPSGKSSASCCATPRSSGP